MKVLMVCLGNICRSPLAEGIFRNKIITQRLNVSVDSAGTIDFHNGSHPDYRSIDIAKKNNIDISNLKARKVESSDFDNFDYVFVMDKNNFNDVIKIAKSNNAKAKVFLLTEFLFPNQKIEIPDPYYGSEKDFEVVYRLLDNSCEKLIEELFL
jgi:protein-tyrosine phosphatase